MTGRQKIESALSSDGTKEIPAVICYEGIYIRDHWEELTSCPWWYQYATDIESQMQWRRDAINRTGQDWFYLPFFNSIDQRMNVYIAVAEDGIYRYNDKTGEKYKLEKPQIAGWSTSGEVHSYHPNRLIETTEEIDNLIYVPKNFDPRFSIANGRDDLAKQLLSEFGNELYPICHASSPLWQTYSIWGFEGMMTMIANKPDIVKHACERLLIQQIHIIQQYALLGASGVWIEECMTDMISPKAFAELNVPFLQRLVEEIRKVGMKSIYYYCGNPYGKWEHIFSIGADAISLEESKKGFVIDIEDVVDKAQGKCAVLGNLDAINLMPNGEKDDLKKEIKRQINAGKRNSNRFIMSIGSPVTPETSVERVRLYCDLVHKYGI
jgi:hypothetical protein